MSKHWKIIITSILLIGGANSIAIADGYEPVGKGFAAPSVQNWTGFYVGGHAGGAWSADTSAAMSGDSARIQPAIDSGAPGSVPWIPSSLDPDASGFAGGVQAGYNRQMGKMVIGLEADISISDLNGRDSTTLPFLGTFDFPFKTSLDTDIKWFSTVRGRVGFLAHPALMVFATGGVAFGETEHSLKLANLSGTGFVLAGPPGTRLNCPAQVTCLAGSKSETSVGWTAGGGFEFALSKKVSFKGEYLYTDLGDTTVTARGVPPGTTGVNSTTPNVFLRGKVENQLHVLRAGVNFKLY